MVYEGFWDLYFRRPIASSGIKSDKLKEWNNFINLSVPRVAEPAEGEEPVATNPVKAAVRVRVPFKEPEVVEGDDAMDGKSQKSARSARSKKSATSKSGKEPPRQEIDWEDRVLPVASQLDGVDYQVFVLHQLPQRLLRQHIAKEFKSFLDKELDSITDDELFATVEAEAEQIESSFFKHLYPDMPVFDFEIN